MKINLKDLVAAIIIITSIISNLSSNIIGIPLAIIWFVLAYLENRKSFSTYFLSNKKLVLFVYFWVIVSIILFVIKNTFMTSYEIKNIIRIAINLLIFGYYFYLEDTKSIKFLLKIALITISIYSIFTVRALIESPNLSRILATENPEKYTGYISNRFVGGYDFAYGITFVLISLFSVTFNKDFITTKNKLLNYIIIALLTITLLYQQFTIALILLIIGIGINLLKIRNIRQLMLWIVIITIIVLVMSNYIITLLNFIAKNIKQETISQRIYEVTSLLEEKRLDNTVDLKERTKKYITSFATFLKDPLGLNDEKEIGNHSELLDEYAKYGVVIATITIIPIYIYIKFIYCKLQSNSKRRIWFSITILYLVFNIINTTMFINVTILIFFVTPAIIYISEEKEKEHENTLGS